MQERQSGGTECKKNFQCPDPAGEAYSAPPDLLAGAERDWLPLSKLPLLSALLASPLLFPHSKIVPLSLHLMRAGDALESHIGYD